MFCGSVYRDSKARGCRLPLDHEGACDAKFVRVAAAPELDDESDAVLERGQVLDDEQRRDERT